MCHDEKRNPKCESRPGAKRPTIVTSVISTRCLGENLVKLETVAVRSSVVCGATGGGQVRPGTSGAVSCVAILWHPPSTMFSYQTQLHMR